MPDPTPVTHEEACRVLRLPMNASNGAVTVREYLVQLLATLWDEREEFSGKRPFGNSDWEYELYQSLVTFGLVPADEMGLIHPDHMSRGHSLIAAAIRELH